MLWGLVFLERVDCLPQQNQDANYWAGDYNTGVIGGAEMDSSGVEPTMSVNEQLQLEVTDASVDGLSAFEVLSDILTCFTKPLDLFLDHYQATLQHSGGIVSRMGIL